MQRVLTAAIARHTLYLLLFVTAAALVLSTAYLLLVRMFTRMIMHITLILSIALNMSAALFVFTRPRG